MSEHDGNVDHDSLRYAKKGFEADTVNDGRIYFNHAQEVGGSLDGNEPIIYTATESGLAYRVISHHPETILGRVEDDE